MRGGKAKGRRVHERGVCGEGKGVYARECGNTRKSHEWKKRSRVG